MKGGDYFEDLGINGMIGKWMFREQDQRIYLTKDRDRWLAPVNMVKNFWGP